MDRDVKEVRRNEGISRRGNQGRAGRGIYEKQEKRCRENN